jgi:hypothetical protein
VIVTSFREVAEREGKQHVRQILDRVPGYIVCHTMESSG